MPCKLRLCVSLIVGLASPALPDQFQLTGTMIAKGQQLDSAHVFQGVGCAGGNSTPNLAWRGAPEDTESFAITVYDPEALRRA